MPLSPIKPLFLLADSQLLFWQHNDKPFLSRIASFLEPKQRNHIKAAYLGASNGDDPQFYPLFTEAMSLIGEHESRMIHSDFNKDDRAFLEKANIILLAGGDTEKGWKVFEKTGIKEILIQRFAEGAILIGVSAGAIQLGQLAWKREENNSFRCFNTMQLVPYVIDAHREDDNWSELGTIIQNGDEYAKGLGLPKGGGAIIHPDLSVEPIRHPLISMEQESNRLKHALLLPPSDSPPPTAVMQQTSATFH
jgi:cyanophycinase